MTNNEDKRADILIFPILTNANHAFELYLKALNWRLNELLDINKKVEGRHNLKQIYQTVKAKFKNYKGNVSYQDFASATKELESYIEELFDKIQATPKNDKMDFSRYSLDNNYEDHFYVTDFGTVEIDLENIVEKFQKIKDNLEQLTDFLYHNELKQNW